MAPRCSSCPVLFFYDPPYIWHQPHQTHWLLKTCDILCALDFKCSVFIVGERTNVYGTLQRRRLWLIIQEIILEIFCPPICESISVMIVENDSLPWIYFLAPGSHLTTDAGWLGHFPQNCCKMMKNGSAVEKLTAIQLLQCWKIEVFMQSESYETLHTKAVFLFRMILKQWSYGGSCQCMLITNSNWVLC